MTERDGEKDPLACLGENIINYLLDVIMFCPGGAFMLYCTGEDNCLFGLARWHTIEDLATAWI